MNRIKELRNKKGVSMRTAAHDLGIPYTTYVNYEHGTREPNSEMLIKLADYYRTSIDYMIGRDLIASYDATDHQSTPHRQKTDDVGVMIDDILAKMQGQQALMFDGDPLSPEALESIRSAMELGIRAAKLEAKQKYTPKKYRKEKGSEKN